MKRDQASELIDRASEKVIVLCTARYSDNLGDGVIGDCFEFVLNEVLNGVHVIHLDIAGRVGYPEDVRPSSFKRYFNKSPRWMRPLLTLAAWPIIFRPRLQEAIGSVFHDGRANLIFGGGQLLSDLALNFPMKLSFVVKNATDGGGKVAFHALGVSRKWSFLGKQIVSRSCSSARALSFVSVRDQDSRENFKRAFGWFDGDVRVTVDPAIFVKNAYGISRDLPYDEHRRIGLGVSDPSELGNYSSDPTLFSHQTQLDFWCELVRGVVRRGGIPVLFTNGSFEDEVFLERVKDRLEELGVKGWERIKRPSCPKELVTIIASMRAIVSHRLHANIVAFGLSVPAVALVWDDKVRSFAKITGLERDCFEPGIGVQVILDRLIQLSMEVRDNQAQLAELQKLCLENARELIRSLGY